MYKTKTTPSIKSRQNNIVTHQNVSNPIYQDLPNISEFKEKQEAQYRMVTSIMFWGLGIVAVTLFYKALCSLML